MKGVRFCKTKKRWVATISINGKKKYLGQFLTEIEAIEIHNMWKNKKLESMKYKLWAKI